MAGSEASKTENFNVTIHKVPTSNNTTIAKTTNERTNEGKKERKKRKEGRKKERKSSPSLLLCIGDYNTLNLPSFFSFSIYENNSIIIYHIKQASYNTSQ